MIILYILYAIIVIFTVLCIVSQVLTFIKKHNINFLYWLTHKNKK